MKIISIIVVLCTLFVSLVHAEEVKVAGTNEIVEIDGGSARRPTDTEVEAFKKPGVPIPVWTKKIEQSGFFYAQSVLTSEQTVQYDAQTKEFTYTKTDPVIQKGAVQFQIHKALLLLAIIVVLAGNIRFSSDNCTPQIISIISLILGLWAGFALFPDGTFTVTGLMVAALLLSVLVLTENSWKNQCLYTVYTVALAGLYLIALFV